MNATTTTSRQRHLGDHLLADRGRTCVLATRGTLMDCFAAPHPGAPRHVGDATRWAHLRVLTRDSVMPLLAGATDRFYVYVLCEPDGTPFYVGKGIGRRIFQHEAEAWNTTRVSHKLNLIRRIRREGGEVAYAIDSFFSEEAAAHARERELIAYYGRHDLGRGPLTNQLDGGEGASNPSAETQSRHAASLGGDAEDPERRAANRFLAAIAGGQDSVPIKPWRILRRTAHLLRPSPGKPIPRPTPRMAKAIAASAIANNVMLEAGAVLPRRLMIDSTECAIENGCGGDMIAAGLVEPVEPREAPLEESLRLTALGLSAVVGYVGREKLIDYGILKP
ncbi:GIY-YIG nuclease family protein [Siccirubricoccus sp. KC 17139]|uniref:GIY-YIG nuclease family protein n=1 Tax=Siccirubricoccus soli TaxID=2899147 RepID=A0ABT1D3W9_9PROT|nr:GIY-YIG nuclease family protein [Siccirubricoccus soli]MCO6415904.1 GIY-YIG nuclease family protein [Siccirubricoccus soli]MCP2682036.1 GIY-YIG nuclease family protein [Siccirubricoccus soli]